MMNTSFNIEQYRKVLTRCVIIKMKGGVING
nr:MAG TPA: hypothetical protein [Caudoviricetes sp.]